MLVSCFTHTQVPLNSDELLEPERFLGAEPQGQICTQLHVDPGSNALSATLADASVAEGSWLQFRP